LRLDDGRIVCVEAAAEQLAQVTAPDSATLIRLAWHIGNRHVPAQLEAERILIRDDPVIVGMMRGLGASVESVMAAFTPESGAYYAMQHPAHSGLSANGQPLNHDHSGGPHHD
jgi:urease accessory protein